MTHISAPEEVGALWLQTFQRAMGRAAHDVKDALNGVSVNLEVIRSRAERPDTPATAVAQFAEAASHQLERLTSLTDAVLVLGRPERDPVDIGQTLRRIALLCSASSSSSDAAVVVEDGGLMDSALSRVDGCAVRLALLSPLLEASTGTDRAQRVSEIRCTIDNDSTVVTVRMAADGRRVAMPEPMQETLKSAGVRWTDDGQRLTLTFPRA